MKGIGNGNGNDNGNNGNNNGNIILQIFNYPVDDDIILKTQRTQVTTFSGQAESTTNVLLSTSDFTTDLPSSTWNPQATASTHNSTDSPDS